MALTLVSACSPSRQEPAWETTADLTARFAVASTNTDTAVIDFGLSSARPHLVSGWSEDRVDPNGLSIVSSVGDRSELSFYLGTPDVVPLRFRCRPQSGTSMIRSLTLDLNGVAVATIALESRLRTYSVDLAAEYLQAGDNRLAFVYGLDPATGSNENTPTVNWFRLTFGDGQPLQDHPVAKPDLQALFLPYGSQVDLPVITASGAELSVERIDFRGGARPRFEIAILDDRGRTPLSSIDSPRQATAVDLGASAPDAVFLSLSAESAGKWQAGDGVYLRRPKIRAPVAAPARRDAATEQLAPRPNILVYLVDTLRSDRLSTYGHDRPTSPHLDEFAAGATLFEKAVGQSSWTRPSVASLFTGTWPAEHAVIKRRDRLPEEASTLAEALHAAGYATAGFSDNVNISKAFGFAQGFDSFLLSPEGADSSDSNAAVFSWLADRPHDRPFFLYVQTADPHNPYLPPEPFRSRFAADADDIFEAIESSPQQERWPRDPEIVRKLLALYDAEVAANDASFGALVDHLRDLSIFDDALVVFLSDHGEEFNERGGWNHGRTLHAETLDFPLVIKLPGQKEGRRVSEVVQHVDILATIADLLELQPLPSSEGRSLLPVLLGAGQRELSSRPGFSHVELVRGLTASIVVGDWKLIDRRRRTGRETRLFNWSNDPTEQRDLAGEHPVRTRALRALLDEKLETQATALESEEAVLDPELEQRLRALGYL